MSGFILMYRDLWRHKIFKNNAARVGAWLWLLQRAAYAQTLIPVGTHHITLERGQSLTTQAEIAAQTGLSRQQVRSLLTALQQDGAISVEQTAFGSIISVQNYDAYQTRGKTDPHWLITKDATNPTTKGQPQSQPKAEPKEDCANHCKDDIKSNSSKQSTQEKTHQATKGQPPQQPGYQPLFKEDKTITPSGAGKPPDIAKAVFDHGVRLLVEAGDTDKSARSFIGKLRKEHSDGVIFEALQKVEREQAVDPKAYLSGCLNHQKAKAAIPKPGDTRTTSAGKKQRFINGVTGWVDIHA